MHDSEFDLFMSHERFDWREQDRESDSGYLAHGVDDKEVSYME